MTPNRRLAAIMMADVVGYSRMMEQDEAGTIAAWRARRAEVLEPVIQAHGGRIVKLMGDGVLVEFGSAVNAVQGAIVLQKRMVEANESVDEAKRIVLRIGINLGDVIGEGADIYGEGVNIAARLESLAQPGGVCISGKLYDEVKSKIEAGFEDLGEQQLKNIAQKVRAFALGGGPSQTSATLSANEEDRPSIAILAFENLSGDPEQEYFADGIAEDIITELSRFRDLMVVARHSSFAFKGKSVQVQQLGRELGVGYVLEGSVRKAGNRVRITAQLIDAVNSAHIWAERIDRDLADLFAIQDEVTERIVSTIANRLEHTEQQRSSRKRPETMRVHDYIMRARAIVSDTKEANQQARNLYEKALELDPKSVAALTGLGWASFLDWVGLYAPQGDNALEVAHDFARKAVALDGTDYRTHLLLGCVQSNRREQADALKHYETAISLNGNDADAAAHMANLLVDLGRFDEALDWMKRAVRLNPLHPAWYLYAIGEAYYGSRQYDRALEPLRSAANRYPTFITPRRLLAAAYAQLGRIDEAKAEIAVALKRDPSLSLSFYRDRLRYANADDLDHYIDGLRKAGLPE
jgi:TolB-like protein/Flp pilus assembly protein TadD